MALEMTYTTLQVEIVDKHNKAYYPQTCSDWVQQPAIVYCGIEWDQLNIYHFFLDNFIRMFAAISDIGAFSQEKFLSWAGLPSSGEANLVIISGRAESYTSGFAYLFDYITPDQWAWPKGVGACYKQLTVGADNAAMTYEDSYSPEDQLRKVDIFARFQRFALAAQLRNESMQGHHISVDQLSSRNSDLIQIGIISRDRDHWSHRLILNEGSVARALHRRYAGKVDVRLIYFNSTLTYAMEAVQQTDILIGVHGAGLTNVLWMKPGRVVVQLIPYGWDLNPGKIRGYRQLTANMECTHLVWVNRKHDNAYFDRYFFTWDFHQKEPPFAYREHPDPADVAAGKQINEAGGLHPQYLYQDTHVDIPSFLPVIDEAMRIMQQPEPAS